jgi:hypothetical protein
MFEENIQNQPPSPAAASVPPAPAQASPSSQTGVPAEPVDMFGDVDKAQHTGSSDASDQPYSFAEEPKEKPWFLQKKVLFLALGAILFVIIVILGIQFAFSYFQSKTAPEAPAAQSAEQQTAPVNEVPKNGQQPAEQGQGQSPTQQEAQPQQPVDTDGDGLSDAEETTLGTDPSAIDTDGDSLTDREEVKVFLSDPRNPDSDGDGYLDGLEVKSGYNPNGEGALPPLPAEAAQ